MSKRPGYALAAVVRLTGLSAHTIRAWERRYAAVVPERTPGGTRRFSDADVARLRLLKEAVDAGHRISQLAGLENPQIERLLTGPARREARPQTELLDAIDRLDLAEVERSLAQQFSVLGPTGFARQVAAPLLREVGDRWQAGTASIASEHLLSAVTRGILGSVLRGASHGDAPHVIFTTPPDERHELGALIAAVAAVGAGAAATYLGPELPVDEVVAAAERCRPAAVALSLIHLGPGAAEPYLRQLRQRLPGDVRIWVGGQQPASPLPGVDFFSDLDELEGAVRHLARLPEGATARSPWG